MREKIEKGILAFNKLEKLVMGVVFIILTALIFVNVIQRWLNIQSFSWLEEISQYTYLCVVFVGTSICISEKGLSKVSVYKNLPAPIVKIIDFSMNLLAIVVCGYSCKLSYSIFIQMLKLKMKTSVLSMQFYVFYGFITICFAVMTIRFFIVMVLSLTQPKSEEIKTDK